MQEIEEIIGIEADDAVRVSAKTGEGVPELLEALIRRIPPPKGDPEAPLQALIIDSWFDNYVGVVSLVRVVNGSAQDRRQDPRDVHRPQPHGRPGSAASRRSRSWSKSWRRARSASSSPASRRSTARRWATPSPSSSRPAAAPLPGFKQIKPRVFAGLFPVELRGLRELPRRAREAEAERLGAALRAGGFRRARVRLSLRLPRPAAHGHRAGAPGARVRARTRSPARRPWCMRWRAPTARCEYVDNPAKLPPVQRDRGDPRAHHHRQHPGAARLRRGGAEAVQRQARRAEEDAVPGHARCRCNTSCRWPRWCSISSTG